MKLPNMCNLCHRLLFPQHDHSSIVLLPNLESTGVENNNMKTKINQLKQLEHQSTKTSSILPVNVDREQTLQHMMHSLYSITL